MNRLSDKIFMKSSESLATLYRIISKAINKTAAYHAVDAAFGNVLHDIRDAGEEITSENLDRRLEVYVNDFIEVAKKTNVA